MCVGSRVHLVGASISFDKNFYRLSFTPLSGSLFWSFKDDDSSKQEKSGSECQQEDEKDEDKECYDEILGEEELLALFSTTYAGSLS
jgi:hypothetical protein